MLSNMTPDLESRFLVPKMDCPSEENLIRMALGSVRGVRSLAFDLSKRELIVIHQGELDTILSRLQLLNLGAVLYGSRPTVVQDTVAIGEARLESVFSMPKMDCASEENLIRMALGDDGQVQSMAFDLQNRELKVVHTGPADRILDRLAPLKLGASLRGTSQAPEARNQFRHSADEDAAEARTLRLLLAINGVMFLVELLVGWVAQSTGLIADSLDMFADAAVYGLALYAVGRAAHLKTRSAHIAGWLQTALAIGAISEVVRRYFYGSEPQSALMMGIGFVALAANVTCLMLIAKKRDRGAHMKASYIFSANDVLANLGVIVAGILVNWTGSSYPDLAIGIVIGLIVLNGARRILRLR